MNAQTIHVAPTGDDSAGGGKDTPLQTISAAAERAMPGDTVIVHEGTYRESVRPPRGGSSSEKRIVYEAAEGETVTVSGAEPITGWKRDDQGRWHVSVPNSLFGGFNPYQEIIQGDWFIDKGRLHHRGAVYLGDLWLQEAESLEALGEGQWFGQVDDHETLLWIQARDVDANQAGTEIAVRETVFYPQQPGCNYITLRGFRLCRAATQWAPPTAEQIAIVGTHWSKGWVIEGNEIFQSRCVGLSLGKYGDENDNTSGNTAEGHFAAIDRALRYEPLPWTRENIGHHSVRNNHIYECEQAGIVGSMGGAFSRLSGNDIHDIHVQRLFSGAELAGIKLHNAIDTLLIGNSLRRSYRGLWLDWGTQGTRVTRNVMVDNDFEDLFVEVNHGPYVVDHNMMLSSRSMRNMSQGGAFLYNLFAGGVQGFYSEARKTPVHGSHDVTISKLASIRGGDDCYIGNLYFSQDDFEGFMRGKREPSWTDRDGGIVEARDGFPSLSRDNYALRKRPRCREEEAGALVLSIDYGPQVFAGMRHVLANLNDLRAPQVAHMPYEDSPEMPLSVAMDFLGRPRSKDATMPGPFELAAGAENATFRVDCVHPVAREPKEREPLGSHRDE